MFGLQNVAGRIPDFERFKNSVAVLKSWGAAAFSKKKEQGLCSEFPALEILNRGL